SGLVTTLVISLVDKDQVAAAEGFTSGVSPLITMIAQFTGSGLLLFMSYSALAFVNGLTFILAGLIYLHLLSSGHEKGTAKAKEEVNDQNFMATLALAFRQVKKAKGLLTVVMVIALLNGILSTIEPLLAIVVASHRQTMVLGTYSFTLALLGVCAASGMALGGIVGTKIFKHLSLYVVVLLATIAASCVIIAASSEKIILCLLTYGLLGFFSGIASPKLTQWMVTTVDRKILASTIGLLNTILVVVGPLMTTVFTTIAAASSVTYALLALLVTNLAVLVVTLVVMSRTTKKS
ncbi:MFS transporter, partial [Lactobacillus sp. XV13L]|nr:MFS transporter [Lactobacillus sp. XV13L]